VKPMKIGRRGVDLCRSCADEDDPRKGLSQVENVHKDAGYIRRTRACKDCGITWSTAEINTFDLKKLRRLEQGLKELLHQ